MKPSEFDRYAQEYKILHAASITASGEEPEFFAEYKARDLRRLCDAAEGRDAVRRLLDFGTGIGASVEPLRRHFPEAALTCVDVSLESLKVAAGQDAGTGFAAIDGRRLPFADATFDCVFSAGVFHHIDRRTHVPLLGELRRVLRPGGLLAVFEHNPLNPLTVRAVDACPFDGNAVLIRARALGGSFQAAGFAAPEVRYRIFFPRALRWLRPLERWLAWLPLGAQYSIHARR